MADNSQEMRYDADLGQGPSSEITREIVLLWEKTSNTIDRASSAAQCAQESVQEDCIALLAYEQPQESSVGYLLEDLQREIVADTLNAMILSTNPNVEDLQACMLSYLERLLRQLTACCLESRSLNDDQGEAFHLQRVLNSGKKARC